MSKDEFLEKHNPNDNYPFWDNVLSKDLDNFIEEHDKQIRADERAKVLDEFANWCRENDIQCRKKIDGLFIEFSVLEMVNRFKMF